MSRLGTLLRTTAAAALLAALTTLGTGPGAQAAQPAPSDTATAARSSAPPSPAPGHHLMLDTCNTPSIDAIRAWQQHGSPYRAIAAYIPARSDYDLWACRDEPSRANLTTDWVRQVLAGGWNLLPIQVGLQAPCTSYSKRMSSDATTARGQGEAAASDAAANARALGIPATSPVVADVEAYSGPANCTRVVQAYLAGWTTRLHQLGLRSAVYGSRASTITDVVAASKDPSYPQPDVIWAANYNGQADTTVAEIPADMWVGRRISQFDASVTRSYGGYALTIDEDAVQDSVWDRTAPRLVAKRPPRAVKKGRVRIGWRFADASGVARYQVQVRHNGGRWKAPKELRRTRKTARTFTLRPGERWCVRARATDRVNNTSAWSAPLCSTRFRDDRTLRAGKGWQRVHGGYLGTGTRTVRKGAVLRGARVSGRYVGVILHGRGTVGVHLRGRLVGQVHGNGTRWLVLPAATSGRISFRTLTRGRTVIDGYAVTP